jgi:hypothetical protein
MGGKALLIEQAPHLGGSTRFAAGAYSGAELPGQPADWAYATVENYTEYLKEVNQGVDGFNEAASEVYVVTIPSATQKLVDWGMFIGSFTRLGGTEKIEGDANSNTAGYFMRQGNYLFADITARMNRFINAGYMGYILNSKVVDLINESLGADSTLTHSPTDFQRWDGFRKAPDQLVWVLGSGDKPRLQDGELGPSEDTTTNGAGNRPWWQEQVDAGNYIWESNSSLGTLELQIRDLATRAGLNPDAVWATVSEYNGYCENGEDPDWGRPVAGLLKMDTGPFRMVKTSGHIKGTPGGIDLTQKAEVPTTSGQPIPGLYAAGEIGGNIAYTGTIWLVGFNLSAEASFGEIAATEALAWSRAH